MDLYLLAPPCSIYSLSHLELYRLVPLQFQYYVTTNTTYFSTFFIALKHDYFQSAVSRLAIDFWVDFVAVKSINIGYE